MAHMKLTVIGCSPAWPNPGGAQSGYLVQGPPGRVLLDWGPIPGSYAWVFPKDDVLTVGVIAGRGEGAATKAYLRAFVERLGLTGIEPLHDSGHLTRCRTDTSPLPWKGNR